MISLSWFHWGQLIQSVCTFLISLIRGRAWHNLENNHCLPGQSYLSAWRCHPGHYLEKECCIIKETVWIQILDYFCFFFNKINFKNDDTKHEPVHVKAPGKVLSKCYLNFLSCHCLSLPPPSSQQNKQELYFCCLIKTIKS